MRNIALALAVLMAVLAAAPLMAAPFRDTPSAHWALDALDQLASKGLVEGYPDTTYKGDRAATRYELAQVVARVVAKIEKMEPPDLSKYATKQDLQTLRRLVDEFRSELDALGVRVGKLEDTLAALEARVTELERVRVSGSVHEVAVFNGLDPQAEGGMRRHMSLNTGAPAHADFTTFPDRGTNSFVIQSATGLVSRADLDVTAKLSSEYQGGVRISAYNLVGSPNATYWAQPAPYLSNANLGFGNNLIAQLDHAWVDKKNTGFHATVGSFTPSRIGDYMYKGQSSPSLLGPDYLPLYGVDLTGGFKTSWLPRDVSYEVFGARLSSNQNLPGYGAVGVAAPGVQFGLNLGTEFNNKLRVNLNFHRVINDAVYMGGATGFIPLPNLWPTWRAVQFGAPSDAFLTGAWGATNAWGLAGGGVGPQDQNTWGIDVGYALPFWKMSQMSASFSSSTYRPFQGSVPAAYAATGQPTQVTGSLWNVEVMGPIGKTNWSLGYFSCSPRYDPFQALMSWPATVTPPVIFHEIAEFTKYYLHYSMHDVRKFPHNRDGFRVMVQYPFDRGMVFAGYHNLQQKEAATLGNITQVGFVEPWFTSLTQVPVGFGGSGGVNVLGRTTKLMLGGGYGFTPRFKGGLMYMSVNHNRATGANLDNIDFLMGIWKVDLDYGFTDKLAGSLGYINGRIEGNYFNPSNAVRNLDMTQSAPYVGLKYGFAKDASVQFRYKFLTQQDGTSPANTGITSFGDFTATLGTAELQFKF